MFCKGINKNGTNCTKKVKSAYCHLHKPPILPHEHINIPIIKCTKMPYLQEFYDFECITCKYNTFLEFFDPKFVKKTIYVIMYNGYNPLQESKIHEYNMLFNYQNKGLGIAYTYCVDCICYGLAFHFDKIFPEINYGTYSKYILLKEICLKDIFEYIMDFYLNIVKIEQKKNSINNVFDTRTKKIN